MPKNKPQYSERTTIPRGNYNTQRELQYPEDIANNTRTSSAKGCRLVDTQTNGI